MELKQDETATAIVPVLACVLNQLCLRNDRLPLNQKAISKFHALRPPAISIKEYLHRIAKYALCSGECFVLALVYIDRIIQGNPTFIVNSYNIHRLLITSVMLAAKFFDDQYFNNAYYAKVGGVPCVEMNSLEVEFLFMTNFTLFVSTETYKQYYEELWNHANSTSHCNCNQTKVPVLVLPFDESGQKRKTSSTQPSSTSTPISVPETSGTDESETSPVDDEGEYDGEGDIEVESESITETSTKQKKTHSRTDPDAMTDSPTVGPSAPVSTSGTSHSSFTSYPQPQHASYSRVPLSFRTSHPGVKTRTSHLVRH